MHREAMATVLRLLVYKLCVYIEQFGRFVSSSAGNVLRFLFVWRKNETFFRNYLATLECISRKGHRCHQFWQLKLIYSLLALQIGRYVWLFLVPAPSKLDVLLHFDHAQLMDQPRSLSLETSVIFAEVLYLFRTFYGTLACNQWIVELRKVMLNDHSTSFVLRHRGRIQVWTIRVLNACQPFNVLCCMITAVRLL